MVPSFPCTCLRMPKVLQDSPTTRPQFMKKKKKNNAHNAAPLTCTCSQSVSPFFSSPRRHVDLNVDWMLSEHYVFAIPSPLLSQLINALVWGESESGGEKVRGCKVKKKSEASWDNVDHGGGSFKLRGKEWRRRREGMYEGENGRGCVQAGGWERRRGKKGKREGEDTSAAAWFTDCTVTMETFVSPPFDPKW